MVTIKYLYNNMIDHSEIITQDEANKKLRENAISWMDYVQDNTAYESGQLVGIENKEIVMIEFRYNHHKVTVDGDVYQMIVTAN